MRIALAQINPIIGHFAHNVQLICQAIERARLQKADLVLFPEMALLGYPPEDLLLFPELVGSAERALQQVVEASSHIAVVLGTIRKSHPSCEKRLHNTAAVIEDGKLLGFQDKCLLPEYDVFYERRYFAPGTETRVWSLKGAQVAITICEDIWQHVGVEETLYQLDPVVACKTIQPDLLLNLSASPYSLGRFETRLEICQKVAGAVACPLFLCNQVGANDGLIFDGNSMVISPKGDLMAKASAFQEDLLVYEGEKNPISILPPVESVKKALVLGISDYFKKQGFSKAILGLSGGIDSAVVAALAVEALGPDQVMVLFLPSRYSSEESRRDAYELAKRLKMEIKELSIEKPWKAFGELLKPYFEGCSTDLADENLQVRIRCNLLMSFSNTFGHLLLSTSNKSESAFGYTTLYGDMSGALSVIGDVTKNRVYALAEEINRLEKIIPEAILKREPTAELRPNQRDSDTLPPYAIVDALIEDYVENRLSIEEIVKKRGWALKEVRKFVRSIHLNEYKRRQAPLSLRVTKKAFSAGRRVPIVQGWDL